MNYTEMLNRIVEESGMSNIEIVKKCEAIGEKITPNYLSILRNTTGRIPSENVSNAIAKVCNATRPDILTIQAYIDKAPKKILMFIEKIYESAKEVTYSIIDVQKEKGTITEEEGALIKKNTDKAFEKMSLADFICDYMTEDMTFEMPPIPLTMPNEGDYILVSRENATFLTKDQIKELNLN